MRKVIVNSTPLIALSNIGRLHILKALYHEITIPQAVFDEVCAKNDSAKALLLQSSDWIRIQTVANKSDYAMYKAKLHAGEVEVMILAQGSPKAELLIIDDNAAKKTAKYLGLCVTGTMGVLLKAKKEGIIDSVAPLLDSIMENGFFISASVRNIVLREAGEM